MFFSYIKQLNVSEKGPHLQKLTDFSVHPLPLSGQNSLNWPETFC